MAMNPYLDQNVNSALDSVSRNYQNTVAPQQASQQASSGSFGNSGLQQQQAYNQRQLADSMGNTAATMYGNAYNTDQANQLQQNIANQQNALGYAGLTNQSNIANAGYANQYGIANMNNQTALKGQDQSYNLGLGNLANAQNQTANQYSLGQQQNTINQQSVNNQYALGQGNLNLGYQNSNNQYTLGQQQNANQATANQNTYNLGLGTLQNNAQSNANQYDLGLRSNDLGYAGLDANIANSNFANQLASANFGLNAFNTQQTANSNAANAGTTIQNTPLDYWNSFNTAANNVGNGLASTTSSQTGQGNPYLGALVGWSLANNLGAK